MGNVNSLLRLKLTPRVPTLVLFLFIPFSNWGPQKFYNVAFQFYVYFLVV